MDLSLILKSVDFVEKYKSICLNYNDFENSISGSNKAMYEKVLDKLGCDYKYYSNGSFYKVVFEVDNVKLQLHLVLKNGLIEPLLYVKAGEKTIEPKGRFDFIPKKIGVEFDRKLYNLPKYTSESDLEEILKAILLICEDIKKELA
jgi:hypothetical protein